MTLDIHVTVELQPSPQLVELLQSWQPEKKPQDAKEPPKGQPLNTRPVHTIMEVPMFMDFTTEKPVPITGNLQYAESENGLVMIKYLSGTIYSLWSEIMKACHAKEEHNAKIVPSTPRNNKQTALNQFIKAVQGGLRKGQAKKKGEISNSKFWTGKEKTPADPDAEFKPMLTGINDTSTNYDGNKLEGSLED